MVHAAHFCLVNWLYHVILCFSFKTVLQLPLSQLFTCTPNNALLAATLVKPAVGFMCAQRPPSGAYYFRLRRGCSLLTQVQFGNSDLYFICRLLLPEGTGADAHDITKCNNEIADACWMPLAEFKEQTKHSMLALVADMLEKPEEKELTRYIGLGWVGSSRAGIVLF